MQRAVQRRIAVPLSQLLLRPRLAAVRPLAAVDAGARAADRSFSAHAHLDVHEYLHPSRPIV